VSDVDEEEEVKPRYVDGWLTPAEARELATQRLAQVKLETNAKARRLGIMQEHKAATEQANALTRKKK